ncbi:LPS O-antigen chain length determinant protein WzzB [Pseudomonas entomophila]|uniref:O-antigen chain length regulator protein (Wzz) n=2 Tax=Pseudomonas entomophila TaxID=312306 RepID=Q1ID96_PSEE4|nr:Wzz/FepE/Etk N-terminal domain-containing protein [Pseudomonas entomophila]WMW04823.1 Wzz/FepE/Etk N-terminal domain-containing protein [Pseudomonas entomophila]CAK14363.1 O-antigen chain length regulator protein (Wzz) [Pseudomonas entomophila L48]
MNVVQDGRERAGEIDFIELLVVLFKEWLLVVKVASLVFALGLVYVFYVPSRYEAKLFTIPPTQNDIAQLNYGRGGSAELPLISVGDVYSSYVRNLNSESMRMEFFNDVYFPSLAEKQKTSLRSDLYRQFFAALSILQGGKDQSDRYLITASSSSPEEAAKWVKQYTQMAGDRAKREVLKNIYSDALVKADNLEKQIRREQESARRERDDRIARLTEALVIARSVGLVKPPIISAELTAQMNGSLTYMRGSDALEAEIANLKKRSSDDPFISNLRQREAEVSFYRSLRIDPALIEVYQQDGDLIVPDRPVSPKSLLVLLIALCLGLAAGACLALARHGWVRRTVVSK